MSESKTLILDRPKNAMSVSDLGKKYLPILEKLIDVPKQLERFKRNYKDKNFRLEFQYKDFKISEYINDLHPHKNCGELRYIIVDDEGSEYYNVAGFKFSETTNCCGSMSVQEKYANLPGCGIGRMLEYLKEDLFRMTNSWSVYATVPNTMPANIKLLESHNWNKVDEFHNFNSGNTVYLFNRKFDKKVSLSPTLEFRDPFKYKSMYANKI